MKAEKDERCVACNIKLTEGCEYPETVGIYKPIKHYCWNCYNEMKTNDSNEALAREDG